MKEIKKELKARNISLPTLRRLPLYLRYLKKFLADGEEVISGNVLAQLTGIEAILVRKDISVTKVVGKPRVGYQVKALIAGIESLLNWDKKHKAVIIGAGALASALISYAELKGHGLEIVAGFDVDPDKIGGDIKGIPLFDVKELVPFCLSNNIKIAIFSLPSENVEEIVEEIRNTNIRAIWNFTQTTLEIHSDYYVVNEDLSAGFAIISSHILPPSV